LHKKDSSYESDFNSTVQLSISKYLARHEVLNISIITYYEILSGLTYKKATRQIDAFKSFAKECNIINLSNEITEIGANIYGDLRRNGFTIGHSDILIAATAISHNLVLITNNQKHYKSIIDLQLDNWS
jgi:tRNA(fMet)-specific endonuclease VapC